jgi:alkylation response protein AidB-like acyl-CoA dehydrogenase
MDFQIPGKAETLRKDIREFVKAELPEDWVGGMLEEESRDEDWAFAMSISKKLAQKGWLTMAWPKEYGGGSASHWEQFVYNEEAGYWSIPGTGMGIGAIGWVGPCLMLSGNEEQKKKYIPLIASGEPDGVWCTGYSEPNAGSDFANIQTKAVKEGNNYLVNGQKVWTSCAHRARWCWLAVRTDPNAKKKQHGMSLLIVDMKSPGITIRPFYNHAGFHSFNEVFFDDVRIPAKNLVGDENRGWYYLMQALSFERHTAFPHYLGTCRRVFDELTSYVKQTIEDGKPLSQDPIVRRRFAEIAVELELMKMLTYEITWKAEQGIIPIYESSRNKVFLDRLLERFSIFGMQIIGAYSQVELDSKWTKLQGRMQRLYLTFPGLACAGGTSEIQKNIVGQFKLGLPRSY